MSFHGAEIAETLTCPIPSVFGSSNGAWLYPCSGAAFFPELGKRSDLYSTFKSGTFPTATLPNFMHEATHHHCFDSPVGYALLSARVAAQYGGAYRLLCQSYDQVDACLENISCCNRVAFNVGLDLLRPLAEGLAMYGQCHAMPGNSPVASPLAWYTLQAYLEPGIADLGRDMFAETANFIKRERANPESQFQRDLAILSKKEQRYEPYWRGYDLVCKLADAVYPLLNDTDATLGFLCSYFFQDEGLAGWLSLLGKSAFQQSKGIDSTESVAEYIKTRIHYLRVDREWREFAVREYITTLLNGKFPTQCCTHLQHPDLRNVFENYRYNLGLEGTSKAFLVTSTKNRRNFKFGSFIADSMEVRTRDNIIRCRFDEVTIEIEGLPQGLPNGLETDDFFSLAEYGSPVVEFVFLDNYQPALALYTAHDLIGLSNRSGTKSWATPADEEKYGSLSPALAFQHDMKVRKDLWNPSEDTPCGAYNKTRRLEAIRLGLELCNLPA